VHYDDPGWGAQDVRGTNEKGGSDSHA
jgi:hypothetical protein